MYKYDRSQRSSGRDYTFEKPVVGDKLTKATKIFLDVFAYDKIGIHLTKRDLLMRAGVEHYNENGEFCNLWSSAVHQNLLIRKNGKIYPGSNLSDYIGTYIGSIYGKSFE